MKMPFRSFSLALPAALLLAGGLTAKPPAKPTAPAKAPASAAAQAPRQSKPYTIDQFLANTSYGGASFSPDGHKILVGSNQTGVFNVFAMPVDGGKPVQLTDSKVSAIQAVGYFPNDERFLYLSDQGGNEKTHLYVQSPDGKVRDLTPGDKLRADFEGWAPDEKAFFLSTNERDPAAMDLYEMSADGYDRKLLYTNDGGFSLGGISPDRRWVALVKSVSTSDSAIYLYDRTASKLTRLTPETPNEEVANGPDMFSRDSGSLYYTTNQGSEFAYLVRYELAAGKKTDLVRTHWDVAGAGLSRDGRFLTVAINDDAHTDLRIFDAATMKPVALPTLPGADVTGVTFSKDSSRMAFYAESAGPRDLYVRDVAGGEARQLTHALNPAIDAADLVSAQVVRFKSYDGLEIPGLLYQPRNASAGSTVPALVSVHGGPGGQSRVGYSGFTQFLVNHGYAVYAINNRGSSGYGKKFFSLDDRKHGEADLDDCVASKKMLAATGWVNPDRIGILGGSYGGYMVLAALAFRPQAFSVGVDMYGVSNWLRTLQSIPEWWGPAREALYKELGDPVKDADYLRRISPLFHADKIERPLIVLQGENDPRVLKKESDEIVEAVRKKGVPVEYFIFPNEGHGFARKESQEKAYQAALEFLDKYLKGSGATASSR
ncbi:MAG TPA: S9 family peptidase [Thermoanaerobaculia bacterium]|jgi:dipeptidyl aminopeptidase/acylaminoacyl peptidase|nr:S9 family peptidase [Thermoanaerobaculia bacterium]